MNRTNAIAEPAGDGLMWAARLYGARDVRVDRVPLPPAPKAGEILLKVTTTSICGSDLHTYIDGRIGDTTVKSPVILGHEFAGVIAAVGPDANDGNDEPLPIGQRVAVDPAMPCGRCEFCEKGHPNLCRRMHFCGLWPDDGSLREYMIMPARTCFPVPDAINDIEAALLEPLGIGTHAVDLARLKVGESIAILGGGPIGLMILQMARLAGAMPILISEPLPWRADLARHYGADIAINAAEVDPVKAVAEATHGRGVDVVFEAAWGAETVAQAAEMACLGGRLVLVGIPSKDELFMRASPARRKGLTIKMSRRMKHVYPRTIRLAQQGKVDLMGLVTHRFPLAQAPEAFALNADYRDRVVKAVVEVVERKT
jgi:L-iditol 2-dehydrogenase